MPGALCCVVVCAFAAIIIGMVKNALLPIDYASRKALREYCTKDGCGMGVTVTKKEKQPDGTFVEKQVLKKALMSAAEFAEKPAAFAHKYCWHHTPSPEQQERSLRAIPEQFVATMDPSCPGKRLFREGGPVMKALEQLILLVRAGKLQGVLTHECVDIEHLCV